MRSVIRRLLSVLGLVRRSHLAAMQQRIDKVTARSARLHEEVQELKRQLKSAGVLTARAEARLAQLTRDTEQQVAALRAQLAERDARVEHEKQRSRKFEARTGTMEKRAAELKVRLDQALHTIQLVQEHLMTTEVKLDIVEGAINVLDLRTRRITADEAAARAPEKAPV